MGLDLMPQKRQVLGSVSLGRKVEPSLGSPLTLSAFVKAKHRSEAEVPSSVS